MNETERERLIQRYAEGPAEVERALEGFPPGRLNDHPLPDKWSAAEIVHHLADSETIASIRLRRLLAEDLPVLQGYDQGRYGRDLGYAERDPAPSMDLFRATRASTVQVLRRMKPDDWTREGWHTETGPYTPERWLQIYSGHAHDHAAQIRRLREALA